MSTELQFVTSLFGERYLPFLVTNLYSVRQVYPESFHVVTYGDIPESSIDPFRAAYPYPQYEFVRIDQPLKMQESKSVLNNKVAYWRQGYRSELASTVIFMDVDTLLLRSIPEVLSVDFDLAVTKCDNDSPKFPINTGVVAMRRSKRIRRFFDAWLANTEAFMDNPKAFVNDFKKYGSGDQLSIMRCLRYVPKTSWANHWIDEHTKIDCFWLRTSIYNNSYSTEVDEKMAILHYKSRWHSILLDGLPLESVESRKDFQSIYDKYKEVQQKANQVFG